MRIKTVQEHYLEVIDDLIEIKRPLSIVNDLANDVAEARHRVQTLELEVEHLKKVIKGEQG